MNDKDFIFAVEWIKAHYVHAEKPHKRSSYAMKHILQEQTLIYLKDSEYIRAMETAGFVPTPKTSNQSYRRYYYVEMVGNDIPLGFVGDGSWNWFNKLKRKHGRV